MDFLTTFVFSPSVSYEMAHDLILHIMSDMEKNGFDMHDAGNSEPHKSPNGQYHFHLCHSDMTDFNQLKSIAFNREAPTVHTRPMDGNASRHFKRVEAPNKFSPSLLEKEKEGNPSS